MRMRLVMAMLIIVGVFALTIAALLLLQRPDRGDQAAEEPGVPTAAAAAPAETINEQRFIDGATVSLVFPSGQQYFTQSEGAPGPVQPQPTQPAEPQPTQPSPTEPPAPTPLPTETPASGTGQPAPAAPSGEAIVFTTYTVAQGDTLYRISTRKDTSIALMAENGIDHRDMVAGNVLQLPIVNQAYCGGYRDYHLVVEGDNVFRIAERFGTTKEQIQQANGLPADYMIKTNDVLCIP